MNRLILSIIMVLSIIIQTTAYDKEKAAAFNKFFSAFTDEAVVKEMKSLCPKVLLKRMELGEEFLFLDIRTQREKDILGLNFKNTITVSMLTIIISHYRRNLDELRSVRERLSRLGL